MRKQMIIAVVMLAGLLAGGKQGWAAEQPHVEVKNLQCESLNSPLGIDVAKPRLSWRIESAGRGQRQSAYQVLVASNPKLLAEDKGDLWDSGKVASDQNINVDYAGKALAASQECHWSESVKGQTISGTYDGMTWIGPGGLPELIR